MNLAEPPPLVGGAVKLLDTETMELRPVEGTPPDSVEIGDLSSDDRELLIIRRATDDDIWLLDL